MATVVNEKYWDKYILTSIETYDVRYPTTDNAHGSDAVHDPDYSAAYCILNFTFNGVLNNSLNDIPKVLKGHGMTFSLGKGNEIIIKCIESLFAFIIGINFKDIISNPVKFSKKLTCHPQFRWLGPEKGVAHMASCAIMNSIFDIWSYIHGKPLWKFICDMSIDDLLKCVDFEYCTDVINMESVANVFKNSKEYQIEREQYLFGNGYPLYTTAVGWLGYSDELLKKLCDKFLNMGFKAFKMKVGKDINDDIRRGKIIREKIGYKYKLMMDANQRWDVKQSIEWMKKLAFLKPFWIEEPTSPDDIVGHSKISKALKPLGIGVATGEVVSNRMQFKNYMQLNALQFVQADTGRLNSCIELLSVLLMAKVFNLPVCYHAGGVGLNEMVRHWSMIDYVLISGKCHDRMCEYAQHLSQHFIDPAISKNGRYYPPKNPGYIRMKMDSIKKYSFPNGLIWKNRLKNNKLKSKL